MTKSYERLEAAFKEAHAQRPEIKLDQAWKYQVMAAVREDHARSEKQSFFSPWLCDMLTSKLWLAGNLAIICLALTMFLTPESQPDIVSMVVNNSLGMLSENVFTF